MSRVDAATVLLQWATGGLLFVWVSTRRREVSLGYGWVQRIIFIAFALGGLAAGRLGQTAVVRDVGCVLCAAGAAGALVVSVVRRKAGVKGQSEVRERRRARVAAMTGAAAKGAAGGGGMPAEPAGGREFPPWLDLVGPAAGVLGLVGAVFAVGGPTALVLVRTLVGAAFLGAVTDAMLLGHWYLVQPGLGRGPLRELNRWVTILWPFEVAALLWPTGMLSVLNGRIDDGYGGTLGWFWVACALTTVALTILTAKALEERSYSAVMAATGLLYLAILTAFGTDLIARLLLQP